MLQAKLSVSETENSRLSSEALSLRRSYDEAKAVLKRETDKRKCVCKCVCVCIYVCVFVCVYVCVFVFVCVCVYL
jgi:hypothetical protein